MMPVWMTIEEATLREMYPLFSRYAIERNIPRHRWVGIQQRARKLGLRRKPKPLLFELDPIVAALVEKRKRLNIAQDVVAKAIRIVPFTLSRYERGVLAPNLKHLRVWCDVLQMRIEAADGFTPSNDDRTHGRAERGSILNHTSVRP